MLACTAAAVTAQTRKPRIEITNIEGVLLTDTGVSVNESTVSYVIEFLPPNATRAEIQLRRDQEPLLVFPIPLQAGAGKFTLPAGLQMDNPDSYLTAEVQLPDGTWSEAAVLSMREREEFEQRDRLAKARFERIEPDLLMRKSVAQSVRIFGTDLEPHVDRLSTSFWPIEAQVVGKTLRFAVPDEAFKYPGFHTISSRTDAEPSIVPRAQHVVLAIADPNLPKPGAFDEARVDGVEYQNDSYEALLVRGVNFRPRMKIVIGRGNTPIEALDTEMRSTRELRTYVPLAGPGGDYFIAVLAADGASMTKRFPIPSLEQMRAAKPVPAVEREKPRLTPPGFRVYGDVAWNTAGQWMLLEGPIAKPGLKVRLKHGAVAETIEASAASAAEAAGHEHPVVRVLVPSTISHKARYTIQIAVHTK
jgi:hypothetical protein